MLKIGELSKYNKIFTKTLRHYDNIGLLQPQVIDPQTGYRFYSNNQAEELSKILILKEAGFSLNKIKIVMTNGLSVQELIHLLKNKQEEIRK